MTVINPTRTVPAPARCDARQLSERGPVGTIGHRAAATGGSPDGGER
jgi:hypothetical protein